MFSINSLSANCDQETFLSADDLRINLWHYENTSRCFTFVDLKPDNMDELQQVGSSPNEYITTPNY